MQHRLASTLAATKPFYVTTPIFYVNAAPHIGHVYSALLADGVARWQRLKGRTVVFATGTDEHGLKVQDAAIASGQSPQAFCDAVSAKFRTVFDRYNVSYTDFIRTTENRHKAAVAKLWSELKSQDHVYMGTHASWYCKSEESFLTETQVCNAVGPDGITRKVSASTGHPVVWLEEPNYKFRLASFQQKLLDWLRQHPNAILPKSRYNEILTSVENGLVDFSVSRLTSNVQWGIPVPDDPSHCIYVWLDALTNYLTVAGYGTEDTTAWPADVHAWRITQVVGKDIIKFHGIYWPAFLMGAKLQLPKHLLAHSHWTVNKVKMSKSLGNIVVPDELANLYGVDPVRYFLLRDGGIETDGDFSHELLVKRLNSDLADTLGNLVMRATAKSLLPDQRIPELVGSHEHPHHPEFAAKLCAEVKAAVKAYDELNFPVALDAIFQALYATNRYFEQSKPWTLKQDPKELAQVMRTTLEAVRMCAILLSPVIPESSSRILTHLGCNDGRVAISGPEQLLAPGLISGASIGAGSDKLVLFSKIK